MLNTILQVAGDTLVNAMPDLSNGSVASTVADTAEKLSLWELATKGGWIMIVLILLSLLALYIFVERLLLLKSMAKKDPDFTSKIRDYIREGKIQSAVELCRTKGTPGAKMIEKGIQRLGRPMTDIQMAVENVGNIEVAKLEKRLPALATVASGAPMIGFLGTVTGMIKAFYNMASAGSSVDIGLLSSGIYEALVTTVGGLVVGILALFAYNYLVAKVDEVITKSEQETLEFMDLINEPTTKR
ncbi:MAG: MotA/TolQ/ExbB proton channel family protein [Bacteroidales bacterium]|uniref:MotA/TolQ/ExbB proton channel family protein n=1 Tax=Porphyromonas sp. TaxID=1924944 RepID=UPI0029763DD2|nr:MotA/TolQ/ExbB proton channel family protein [Porphyromonas sp.]MDD7438116.1 MotA/TolQ/ExbB proton channel family protein [Bacteroidales bacterium]MDY3066414.1 MotA/TolQ/ExbB proton channel family protein [Porphyromonas sp.]